MISNHFDKDNIHHAYLIEGLHDGVLPEILEFAKVLGVSTSQNPDFCQINTDVFKIDDARNLKAYGVEGNMSESRRIFIISANSYLDEAQNSLLKIIEEPIAKTHFFLIVPDKNSLLDTFVSRFYLITSGGGAKYEQANARSFVQMPLRGRIDFVKELLVEAKANDDEPSVIDSARAKAHTFINKLEQVLHDEFVTSPKSSVVNTKHFQHLFEVRRALRMTGSSPKTLLESLALVVPEIPDFK